jgi:hypothetical protein
MVGHLGGCTVRFIELQRWAEMGAPGRLNKSFRKLPTGRQLLRQKLRGLKPGLYGE